MNSSGKFLSAILWAAMAVGAAFIAYRSVYYVFSDPSAFGLKPDAPGETLGFRLHALGGVGALILGPLQFLSVIRRKAPPIHRWTGRAYLACVAVGSAGAFILALNPMGGAITKFAFFMLAALWVLSTSLALLSALRRDFASHRRWMIRSYALTYAAVTLRIGIPALIVGLGMTMSEAYQTVAWASWTINLLIAEWFIVPRKAEFAGAAA